MPNFAATALQVRSLSPGAIINPETAGREVPRSAAGVDLL